MQPAVNEMWKKNASVLVSGLSVRVKSFECEVWRKISPPWIVRPIMRVAGLGANADGVASCLGLWFVEIVRIFVI